MIDWETIAQRSNGQFTADDFERACYRLITEQVIYRGDHGGATAYWILSDYERDIGDALDLVGVDLAVNRTHQFAVALPRHAGMTPVSTDETLIALVLRYYYDQHMRQGATTDDGEVICDLDEFGELYRHMTQRELPSKGVFNAALRSLRRWGIARELDNDEQMQGAGGAVVIRPAIVEVLGESALTRLATVGEAKQSVVSANPEASSELEGGGCR